MKKLCQYLAVLSVILGLSAPIAFGHHKENHDLPPRSDHGQTESDSDRGSQDSESDRGSQDSESDRGSQDSEDASASSESDRGSQDEVDP